MLGIQWEIFRVSQKNGFCNWRFSCSEKNQLVVKNAKKIHIFILETEQTNDVLVTPIYYGTTWKYDGVYKKCSEHQERFE